MHRRSRAWKYAAWIAAVLALYVLSVGPAWWLVMHGYLSKGIFDPIYYPLHRSIFYVHVLRAPYLWYMDLWM